ncbi:polyphenol oxidase family protein [bacterium]|nr:polyphenol oxidase family protein [bacterium]
MLNADFELDDSGLVVRSARWSGVTELVQGITTRAALPDKGKGDFFDSIAKARASGALPQMITLGADQVHSDKLVVINEPIGDNNRLDGFRWNDAMRAGEFSKTDALVTTLPGVLLIIQTADCLPVFAIDPRNIIAGLAHCGWRGLRAGLAGQLVEKMAAAGAEMKNMQVWLGPCICAKNYEVSKELVEEFQTAFPGADVAIDERHLDMIAIARHQAEIAGVDEGQIAESGQCTLGSGERFHSWRGQGSDAGRMLSFLGFV